MRRAANAITTKSDHAERLRRLAQASVLSALALILSYLETMIPLPFAVPGIKLGLANVVVLVALYECGVARAGLVMCVKVLASGFLFGSPLMLAYSAGGALLAFAGMLICKNLPFLGIIPTSMCAAVLHNLGQLMVAAAFLSAPSVLLTLPPLAVAACITGFLTGLVAEGVVESVPKPSARPYSFSSSDLDIHPGSVMALIGRNGSGKTTLALQMAGLVPSNASETKMATDHSVGICFQCADDQIVRETTEKDTAFGPENRGIPTESIRRIVKETLERLHLDPLAHRRVSDLSGGERHQVATAGLMALSPRTLFFDESEAMLSPDMRREFWKACKQLAGEGHSVIVATHSIDDAFACDYLAVLSDGEVKAQGSTERLSQDPDFHALLEELGLGLPFALQLSLDLKKRGVNLPLSTNEESLVSNIFHAFERKEGVL